jgi:hypothetical protein
MNQNLAITTFLGGAAFAAYLVIAYLFWRAWQDTRDRLFKLFSAAFAALGVERLILVLVGAENESIHFVYIVRLLAFTLIIWAIIEKNRTPEQ